MDTPGAVRNEREAGDVLAFAVRPPPPRAGPEEIVVLPPHATDGPGAIAGPGARRGAAAYSIFTILRPAAPGSDSSR